MPHYYIDQHIPMLKPGLAIDYNCSEYLKGQSRKKDQSCSLPILLIKKEAPWYTDILKDKTVKTSPQKERPHI